MGIHYRSATKDAHWSPVNKRPTFTLKKQRETLASGVLLPIVSRGVAVALRYDEFAPCDDQEVGMRPQCTIYSKGILCTDQVLECAAHSQTVLLNEGSSIH